MDKTIEQLLQDENIEKILSKFDTEKQIRLISDVLKKCRNLIKSNTVLKKMYFHRGENEQVELEKREIKRLKHLEKKLNEYKKNLYENYIIDLSKENKIESKNHFEDSCYRMIVSALPKVDDNLQRIHEEYLKTVDPFMKRDLLLKMEALYIESQNKLEEESQKFTQSFLLTLKKDKDIVLSIRSKKKMKEFLLLEEYKEEKEQYDTYKLLRKKYSICLSYIHKLIDIYDRIILKSQETKEDPLDCYEIDYESYFDSKQVSEQVKYYIESLEKEDFLYLLNNNELKEYISTLTTFINSLNFRDVKIFCSMYLRGVKSRIRISKKNENLKEQSILEELKKIMKDTLKNLTISDKKDKNYYYDILIPFLKSNSNYYYIKQFLCENPNFIDARDEKHITLEIVDQYILNMKLKCVNQGISYIDPEYYYQLFFLFFKDYNPLNDEEEEELTQMLDSFKKYVLLHHYKEQEVILNQIENLKHMSMVKKENIISEELVKNKLQYLKNYRLKDVLSTSRVDLTEPYLIAIKHKINQCNFDESVSDKDKAEFLKVPLYDIKNSSYIAPIFTFENGKYAYSIQYDDEGNTLLKIHMLDTRILMEHIIEEKMKQEALNGKRFPILDFESNIYDVYPTITYQLKLYANNEIGEFKYYASKIQINQKYSNKDLEEFRNEENLRHFISTLKKMNLSYGCEFEISDFETFIDNVLSNEIMKLSIPFIYVNERKTLDDIILKNHYEICHLLMHISKHESDQINKIITSNPEDYYSSERKESSHIIVDSSHYLGFLLQKCLMLFSKQKEILPSQIEEMQSDINSIVDYLNQNIGYIPHNLENNYEYRK